MRGKVRERSRADVARAGVVREGYADVMASWTVVGGARARGNGACGARGRVLERRARWMMVVCA